VRYGTRTEDLPNEPRALDGSYSGEDRLCAVKVVLDGATDDVVVHLAPDWRRRVDPAGLEDAIVEALSNAADARLSAWAANPSSHGPRARRQQEGHTGAPSTSATPPPVPNDARSLHVDTVVTPDELLAAVVHSQRKLGIAELGLSARLEAPIVVTCCCGRVRTTLQAGRLAAIGLDRAWAAAAENAALERFVADGLRVALDALLEHVQPDRVVVARVDDLAARALATCRQAAQVKEAAAPPPAVDQDSWPDHVAKVLVALDAVGTPWQVAAARHLQRAADVIARQGLPRSAFSFAGNATPCSYETLHQTIVGLLLDGARTFVDAATGTPTGTGIHDTTDTAGAHADDHVADEHAG
jgi:hypothetical protein